MLLWSGITACNIILFFQYLDLKKLNCTMGHGQNGEKIRIKLIKIGSDPNIHHGSLNDPVYRASTIIFNNYKSFKSKKR